MWGTFLSEPLPIIGLVGRCPANYLIGRMAISNLGHFTTEGCPSMAHGALIHVSMGYAPVEGRFHTRYSPVRRSPPGVLPPPRCPSTCMC